MTDLFAVTVEDTGGTDLSFPEETLHLNLIPNSVCQDPGGDIRERKAIGSAF